MYHRFCAIFIVVCFAVAAAGCASKSQRDKEVVLLPLQTGSKYWLVGICLDSPGNLWCLAPSPQDWGPDASVPRFFPSSVKPSGEGSPIAERLLRRR